jgi:hypothetical protein
VEIAASEMTPAALADVLGTGRATMNRYLSKGTAA